MKKLFYILSFVFVLVIPTIIFLETNNIKFSGTLVGNYDKTVGLYPTVKGKINSEGDISKTVCNPNWSTKEVRPSTSYTTPLKNKLAKEQNVDPTKYELDHAVSLVLLGDPKSTDNLWLEPYDLKINGIPAGAKEKDRVEVYLHMEVCKGNMTLKQAQQDIVQNWFEIYKTKIYGRFGAVDNEIDEDDV